jgi:hypothetical protein
METARSSRPHHPTRMQNGIVWITLFAVPLIWVLHLLLCITLVSSACSGGVAQRDEIRWDDAENLIAFASAAAVMVCLVLAIATGRAWRRINWRAHGRPDATCFIAWCSALTAVVFTGVLAFTACVLIAAPFDRLCAPFQ